MNNIKIINNPKPYVSTEQMTFFYRPKLGFTNITQGREKVVLTFFAYFLVLRQESKVGVKN